MAIISYVLPYINYNLLGSFNTSNRFTDIFMFYVLMVRIGCIDDKKPTSHTFVLTGLFWRFQPLQVFFHVTLWQRTYIYHKILPRKKNDVKQRSYKLLKFLCTILDKLPNLCRNFKTLNLKTNMCKNDIHVIWVKTR